MFRFFAGRTVHQFATFERALTEAQKRKVPVYDADRRVVAEPVWVDGEGARTQPGKGAKFNGYIHANGEPL